MLSAFQAGAGFSANDLGILFRTFFATMLTLWAAWVAYRQYFIFASGVIKLGEWGKNMIFLVMMWTFLMSMVVV